MTRRKNKDWNELIFESRLPTSTKLIAMYIDQQLRAGRHTIGSLEIAVACSTTKRGYMQSKLRLVQSGFLLVERALKDDGSHNFSSFTRMYEGKILFNESRRDAIEYV